MSLAATIVTADNLSELEEESQIVVVDHLRIAPEEADPFSRAWAEDVARLRSQPGFVSAQLRPAAGDAGAYLSIVVWRSADTLRQSLRHLELPGFADRFMRPRAERSTTAMRRFGSIVVDPEAREVLRDGEVVRLTRKEFELLATLISAPGRVFTRGDLMDRIWGYRAAFETGTLSVHMSRLRTKLEDDPAKPRYLQTVWGLGYRFVP